MASLPVVFNVLSLFVVISAVDLHDVEPVGAGPAVDAPPRIEGAAQVLLLAPVDAPESPRVWRDYAVLLDFDEECYYKL